MARKSRALNKRLPDGRCYDGRTKAPEGCCIDCWHASGAEVPGRLYAFDGLGVVEPFVTHFCQAHATETFPVIREGVILPLEDGLLPWVPAQEGCPEGVCFFCWEGEQTCRLGKSYVFGEEYRGIVCETCAEGITASPSLRHLAFRPAQGG